MTITIAEAVEYVRQRIRQAFITLARMPDDSPRRLQCGGAIYTAWGKEYGKSSDKLPVPTAKEIDDMDEVLLDWMPYVTKRAATICRLRSYGVPVKQIALELGVSPDTVKKTYRRALEKLVWIIAQGK